MQRLQAFKFRLAINGEQRRNLRRFAGACRFVYNKALAWQSEQYKKDNTTKFSYKRLANLLPEWKKELFWLKEAPSQSLSTQWSVLKICRYEICRKQQQVH